MESFFASAALEFWLTIAAFVALGGVWKWRTKTKKQGFPDETLGEDVPPMTFTGRIHPKSLPRDFGKGPNHK